MFLLVGGAFLIIRNSSKTKNPSNKPSQEEKKDKPIPPKKDNPQPDQPKNSPQSPQPNSDPTNNDKTEIKVFWEGGLELFDKWRDYWVFTEAKNGNWMLPGGRRFLIAKNTPVLVDKDLGQEDLLFTLSYSKNQGSKIERMNEVGETVLTMVESNFTLIPFSPTKDDPDFLNRWQNTKVKEVYFDYSRYTGGDYIFIDRKIQEGKSEKDLDKYVFHPTNPFIQKLLAKNHLQNQPKRPDKSFNISYLERDIEKYDPATRTYYLNNQAKVGNAVMRP